MLYLAIFAFLIFSAYFVPFFLLQNTDPSLNYVGFWTLFAVLSIALALVIMSKWREEE